MKLLPLLLLFFAEPFWESKPPADWSDQQLLALLSDSPWAQPVTGTGKVAASPVQIYLATAAPMELAERERERRYKARRAPGESAAGETLVAEYRAWLQENLATQIVLAVAMRPNDALSDERETRQMEKECVMRVGRKKYKLTGHFPPSAADPYLRLAFPREVGAADKTVTFDLYLPGIGLPFRSVEFKVQDMMVKGKLEM
jgi:hypothetical protein